MEKVVPPYVIGKGELLHVTNYGLNLHVKILCYVLKGVENLSYE